MIVTKLDSVEVLNAKTVCRDETVQSQNFVHLNGCDERAAPLPNDMCDWKAVNKSLVGMMKWKRYVLADTWDNLEVKGAAQEASPSLIFGTSSSPSISAIFSVIEFKSN